MTQAMLDALKEGDVLFANYPIDNPLDPNKYKPRNVVLLDKFSKSYYRVICIMDLEKIKNQKGIEILIDDPNFLSMKLTKNSFINFDDCQTIPSMAVKHYRGKCPKELFEQI